MSRIKKAGKFVKTLAFIYPMTVRSCPGTFFGGNLCGLLAGLLIGIQTSVTASLFNAVSVMTAEGYRKVLLWGGILGAVVLGNEAVNGVMNYLLDCTGKKAAAGYRMRLHEKAGRLSAQDYEKTEVLDLIEKASQGAENASGFVSEVTELMTIYVPYLLYMGCYLYLTSPALALVLPVIFVPVVMNQGIRSRIFAGAEDLSAAQRRKRDYYRSCIADREYLKETRLLGESAFFAGKFREVLRNLFRIEQEADRKTDGWKAVMAGITLLGYCGVLLLLVRSLLRGEIRVGSFAAVLASVDMMYGIMCETVEGRLGSIAGNFGTVKNFMDFFAYPDSAALSLKTALAAEKCKDRKENTAEDTAIEVKAACYRYPGAETAALHDINLRIQKGETLAVVGENGAGKSTLMKLLMGLYLPESGQVKIFGRDTSQENCQQTMSAVFQQFQRYQMKLSDNVSISALKLCGTDEIENALEQADIPCDMPCFPEGLDTMLSRQFGGTDLSGGQWQRVAIARGICRKHDILFLDEPTAAIDPAEETRLYRRFQEMCRGKTAVIVTHRMGCARIADRIVVMKDGQNVEEGSHQELYEKGGWYRRYWDMQAEGYTAI